MNQNRNVPVHILVSIRVRGNLAYVAAQSVNRSKPKSHERSVYKEILDARVLAFLGIISEGARYQIQQSKGVV